VPAQGGQLDVLDGPPLGRTNQVPERHDEDDIIDTRKLDPIAKRFNKLHQAVYRKSKGRFWSRMQGVDLVILTTVGRKTGQLRTTVVGAPIITDELVLVLASYAAGNRNPQWYYNLLANPAVEILVKGKTRSMIARDALGEEKAELWNRSVASGAQLDKYQSRTERSIPLVILEPAQ
jgi:F420H(2)-dependent quinone reductase